MSLGSPLQWQAALLTIVPFVDTAPPDLPKGVIITTIIGVILFCQYDYTEGTVIASLAAIEEPPDFVEAEPLKDGDATAPSACEKGLAVGTSISPQSQPAGINKYLRHIRHVVTNNLIVFVSFYLLSFMGIISENFVASLRVYCLVSTAVTMLSSIPKEGLLFKIPSNAITKERSRVRRHLRDEGGRWSLFRGFDIFLAYMLLTILGLILVNPLFAQESLPFPAYVLVRLCLGLPLTNLHMACVHAAISKQNRKPFWQRIPGWHDWITIAPVASLDIVLPASAHFVASQILAFLHQSFPSMIGAQACHGSDSPANSYGLMVLSATPYVLSFLASAVTRVIYIRVSASLLPDDDEPVIPYDRGGSRINNGSVSPLIILNACRTISLDNYLRYLRTVTDVAFYEMGWLVFLLCIVSVEVALFAPCVFLDYALLFANAVLGCSDA
ncbi:uncharacterized protein ASPGLDRAFT_142242 [Aspergillus glaucus CBS 516.65]|uniref:Solute carrier family 40 protein n=1 Tax=Aspergillus glaucus CBS 516.65 TaxID=1160497 RepID=A0A1L9VUW2_ASPGL|nr:hypothetical protein ASPGLDRAFT_142242 [Aspergillus glaucus CBS 516.65]OJJ87695.1 hypothetical protein ASPGLDRAFT_142242 [Aspergillus glaucus CBS 516.65]